MSLSVKPFSRLALAILTHVLALAGGWAIYQAKGSQPAGKPADKTAPVAIKAADRTATAETKSGQTILAEILKPATATTNSSGYNSIDRGADANVPAITKELRDRIDSIAIPADIGAAIDALMAGGNSQIDILALGFHWLSTDPEAFIAWMKTNDKRTRSAEIIIMDITPELYRRSGVEEVLSLVGQVPHFNLQIGGDLAKSVAKSGDAVGIIKARDVLTGNVREYFSRAVGSEWPNDKLADLIKLAVECDGPEMIVGHQIGSKNQGAFIAGILADESIPEDFRREIAKNQGTRDALAKDPTVPLDTRLQNGANLGQVVSNDVGLLLTRERDWTFAFRNGEASAEDIMNIISAGTPDLVRKDPGAVRNHLFNELSEENPTGAMKLLKDLPDDERYGQALYTARTYFQDVEPSKFLELMEQVPVDTPVRWEGRLDAWNLRSFTNNGRLQDGYVEWVQSLPPGLDRDMGLYSLARAINESNPQLAASLRSQVVDSDLKQRIAKHR